MIAEKSSEKRKHQVKGIVIRMKSGEAAENDEKAKVLFDGDITENKSKANENKEESEEEGSDQEDDMEYRNGHDISNSMSTKPK